MACIFVDTPKECSKCYKSCKLQCLLNHQYLKLSEEGKTEMHEILEDEMNTNRRFKRISGHKG